MMRSSGKHYNADVTEDAIENSAPLVAPLRILTAGRETVFCAENEAEEKRLAAPTNSEKAHSAASCKQLSHEEPTR